jgi:hypothetical protein
VLAKSIQTELEDGDGRGDMMRALENMRNSVEVMLKAPPAYPNPLAGAGGAWGGFKAPAGSARPARR